MSGEGDQDLARQADAIEAIEATLRRSQLLPGSSCACYHAFPNSTPTSCFAQSCSSVARSRSA